MNRAVYLDLIKNGNWIVTLIALNPMTALACAVQRRWVQLIHYAAGNRIL